ncbi:MAG: phospholipase [Polyangiaceae bacterium]|nr:phospholipase [Polyangiaceae bacterium]
MTTSEPCWCSVDIDLAGLLIDGRDYYRAFCDAALKAERYILLAGWQFDSKVKLLRGEDAAQAAHPVKLKELLNWLCANNPQLRIYMLAWDFHVVFALEREWLQQVSFDWTTHENIHFLFDAAHPTGACHHQKFVVVDDQIAFLGGIDICEHRWDTDQHRLEEPHRKSRGLKHPPFHDVQAFLRSRDAALALRGLFESRWQGAGGEPLDLAPAGSATSRVAVSTFIPDKLRRVAARSAVISRTDPYGRPTNIEGCQEIKKLLLRAIDGAERCIYIETQYLSARAVGLALGARLADDERSRLDVVVILNPRAENFKEEVAIGLAQARIIADLRRLGAEGGHRVGVYFSRPGHEGCVDPEGSTYIHSKVMIVDDTFLTVGSANLTNRSLSLDTELNVSFEADGGDADLVRSIRAIRRGLLTEHAGLELPERDEELIAVLDDAAERRRGKIRPYPPPTEQELELMRVVDPEASPFDPDLGPSVEQDQRELFSNGLSVLWEKLKRA